MRVLKRSISACGNAGFISTSAVVASTVSRLSLSAAARDRGERRRDACRHDRPSRPDDRAGLRSALTSWSLCLHASAWRRSRPGQDCRRIVVAAGAFDDQQEVHNRRAVIFEHHQVHAVREVRFLRLRQRDLQDLLRDRRLVLRSPWRGGAWPSPAAGPRAEPRASPTPTSAIVVAASLLTSTRRGRLWCGDDHRPVLLGQILRRHALHVGGGHLLDPAQCWC